MRFLDKLIGKIVVALFVFLFLQMPFFMSDYMSHLEGHLEELKFYKEQLVKTAEKNQLTLAAYLEHFAENPDKIVESQGKVMQETLERFAAFQKAYNNFREASVFKRSFVFVQGIDWTVAKETLSSFQIGFSLSLESLCYMVVGLLIGFLVYAIFNPFKRRSKNDKDEKRQSDV